MTQVIKNIRGQKYLYFQDSYKINGKYKTITTMIGKEELQGQEFEKAKEGAFGKHILKIFRERSLIGNTPYHFETITTGESNLLEDSFEYIKRLYNVYRRSLSTQELEEFEKILFVKYVHGTTAIEGNTLSEEEAFRLLASDLTPANKTINETIEVSNYNIVRKYLESYNGPVTEKLIRRIHALLMNGVKGANEKLIDAGNYRTNKAILVGVGFKPAPPEIIVDKLRYLLQDYYGKIEHNVHPMEISCYFHQKFEEIHPFQDGNGRIGREILNYMLEQNGFPPIYIMPKNRSEYLTALQKGNEEDYEPLFGFITSRTVATLEYITTMTSAYEQVLSDKTKQLATEMGIGDVYERMVTLTKRRRELDELP